MNDIQEHVQRILAQNNISRPPIPVERIASSLGLEVRYASLDADVSGAIFRNEGEVVIGVNSFHHPNRQRFTIAHEIAHFILHKGLEIHLDNDFRVNLRNEESSLGVDSEEIQANRFAAELLMPTSFIQRDTANLTDVDAGALQRLAKRYKVSQQAMQIRLVNLGLLSPIGLEG